MSQSALPWMHWSMLQTPALHAGTPLKTPHVLPAHPALTQAAVPLAMLHVPPHVPQLRRSLRRSVSQPFSARLSQSPNPTLHANVHAPSLHAPPALRAPVQERLQPPQLRGLSAVPTSQPLPTFRSQSAKPGSHVPMLHLPRRQPAVPWSGAPHALPQPPQFFGSLKASKQPPLQHVCVVPEGLFGQSESLKHIVVQMYSLPESTQRLPRTQLSFCGRHTTHLPLVRSQRGVLPLHMLSLMHAQGPSQPT